MANTITGGAAAGAQGYLCTLAQAKAALKIPTATTTSDALITELLAAATKWAQGHTGRDLIATDYVEYFSPGSNSGRVSRDLTTLRILNYPLISVASIYQDSTRVFAPGTLVPATDYDATGTLAIKLYATGTTSVFAAGERTVKASYRAGHETIPADLSRAGVMLTVHLFHGADRQKQGLASESIGDHTLSYLNETMPKEAAAILNLYKRPCGL